MDFRFSTEIDPSTYQTDGLCDGYPLRMHRNDLLADLGCLRAHEDWNKLVAPVKLFKGGISARYNWMSVSVPECLPGRLEILAYANEIVFLHDDVIESVDKSKGDQLNDVLVEGFDTSAPRPSTDRQTGSQMIQGKFVSKMLAVDKERALQALKLWAMFLQDGGGRRNHTPFYTLDDYMKYRVLDVGEMYWTGILTFGMGLTVSDQELDVCSELCRPAWLSCGLINDLYSWPKEKRDAASRGESHVSNSVWVLMQEHGIDEADAICLLREKIKDCFSSYSAHLSKSKGRKDLSKDAHRFMEALQFSMVANVVWSVTCPRYNESEVFNERQMQWIENGTPKEPGVMGCDGITGVEVRNKRAVKRTRDDVGVQKQFCGNLRRSKRLKAGRA